jgi:hypothetical protein
MKVRVQGVRTDDRSIERPSSAERGYVNLVDEERIERSERERERDGAVVLPRDAPRTGGDVELFPRRARDGASADRPARLGHGCVVVVVVFGGEWGVFRRAERGECGGGVETGRWEWVSGALDDGGGGGVYDRTTE